MCTYSHKKQIYWISLQIQKKISKFFIILFFHRTYLTLQMLSIRSFYLFVSSMTSFFIDLRFMIFDLSSLFLFGSNLFYYCLIVYSFLLLLLWMSLLVFLLLLTRQIAIKKKKYFEMTEWIITLDASEYEFNISGIANGIFIG